jgi:ribonuclease HI
LIEDLDIQILDLQWGPPNQVATARIINVYNQKQAEDVDDQRFAVDKLADIELPLDIPTILVGDWNTKHPDFCIMPDYAPLPNERATSLVQWLNEHGFTLKNQHNQPTRIAPDTGTETALDLTFVNTIGVEQRLIHQWSIVPDLNGDSDHYATVFGIGRPGEEIRNVSESRWNWRATSEDKFIKELKRAKQAGGEKYRRTFGPITRLEPRNVSAEMIDDMVKFLTDEVTRVAKKVVPKKRTCTKSREWWNDECRNLVQKLKEARALERLDKATTGQVYPETTQMVKHAQNVLHRKTKKLRKVYFDGLLKGATPQNIWKIAKWPNGTRQYPTPPISRGEGFAPAILHSEKCEVFRTSLLPPPPDLPNARYPDLDPRESDLPWNKITHNEIRRSIHAAASFNAPGPSGLGGAAWKWCWVAYECEISFLVRAALETGYHPRAFHDSITVVLQKPAKPDYSIAKAYRPIQLLEVLGKCIERIQARRLSYICLKHNLIPPQQLGGVQGRSAEDLALSVVHDIEAAWNHGRVASFLTFDITGFFNNVSHPVLLTELRKMGIPLRLVQWVRSFLSDRRTIMCVDGKRDEIKDIETGIPQGSCILPILAACLTASLGSAVREATAEENSPPDIALEMRRDKSITSPTALYVDDGGILTHSDELQTNTKVLGIARSAAESWLRSRGMRTEPPKDGLIHFSRRRVNDEPPVITRLPDGAEITVPPATHLKWIGITFDQSLKFTEHTRLTAAKATRAIGASAMLGNSVRGLNQYNRRLLYLVGIRPILSYASTIWWKGSKSHAQTLSVVQNKALRLITGAFKTTPTRAMEIEASIPPIGLHLDYLNSNFATRLRKLPPNHPIVLRLPIGIRPPEEADPHLPFPLPHKPARHFRNAARRDLAIAANAERNRNCTRLWSIAKSVNLNSEAIDILANPPWHRTEWDADLANRIHFRLPPNTPEESFKETWAADHTDKVLDLKRTDTNLLVYTDGSLSFDRGNRKTGWGFAFYQGGELVRSKKGALGAHVEVYDAEMEGLASAAEAVADWIARSLPHKFNHVYFFTDNTGAIQRIFRGTPGKAQACSNRFREIILRILDSDVNLQVSVEWTPGHFDIEGNDMADSLAKEGSADPCPNPGWHSLSFIGSSKRHTLRDTWINLWAATARRPRAEFTPADRFAPQLRPTARFLEMDRPTFSRVIQARTGHAHIGSYYRTFVPTEPSNCTCGHDYQTRNHILSQCTLYTNYRHLLGDEEEQTATAALVGTTDGIVRLAAFIKESGAFSKTQ